MTKIIVEGLDELRARMSQFPGKFQQVLHKTVEASLMALWEAVPPYPPAPADSDYVRTGTLGRTMGADGGQPDIYEVKQSSGYVEGTFGTNLEYAQYVIGENNAWMHKNRWWTILTVAEKAKDKIEQLFQAAADEVAKWLDGKGL